MSFLVEKYLSMLYKIRNKCVRKATGHQVSDGGLLEVHDAHIFALGPFFLIIVIYKECQQVDAQESTFNNVAGNQNNVQIIVNNPPHASVEEADEDICIPIRVSTNSLLLYGQPLNLYPRKILTLILS